MTFNTAWEASPTAQAYLSRIAATSKGILRAVREVEGAPGYFRSELTIRIHPTTFDLTATASPSCSLSKDEYSVTEAEQAAIKAELHGKEFPKAVLAPQHTPFPVETDSATSRWAFRLPDGQIQFWEAFWRKEDGSKVFVRYQLFSDGQVHKDQPENPVPWGLEQLASRENSTAYIFEGAKTAEAAYRLGNPSGRAERELADSHPWALDFRYAACLGFTGGIYAAKNTDWSWLRKFGITDVVLVPDCDSGGRDAMFDVAEVIDLPSRIFNTSHLFPSGWDVFDKFPDSARSVTANLSLFQLCEISTPVLVEYFDADGKPQKTVNRQFSDDFVHLSKPNLFIDTRNPRRTYDATTLGNHFAYKKLPEKVMEHRNRERVFAATWEPMAYGTTALAGYSSRRSYDRDTGQVLLNTYFPTSIKPVQADPKPFLDFMEHLIPGVGERDVVMRWFRTLVAHADRRLFYGLVLLSEQTGTGKSLFMERILSPLVGLNNTSQVAFKTLLKSDFNEFLVEKRLVICNEMSFDGRAIQARDVESLLRDYITATRVRANLKYLQAETINCNISMVLADNSFCPFPIPEKERRFYVPTVTEEPYLEERSGPFLDWLEGGGLGAILNYCLTSSDYIDGAALPPMTPRKRAWIQASKSENVISVERIAELALTAKEPIAVGTFSIREWLKSSSGQSEVVGAAKIRKSLMDAGLISYDPGTSDGRCRVEAEKGYVLVNAELAALNLTDAAELKAYLRAPHELISL